MVVIFYWWVLMDEVCATETYRKDALAWFEDFEFILRAERAYQHEIEKKLEEATKFYEKASKFLNCSISFEKDENIKVYSKI
jgi:hypothetical protein